MTPKQKYEMHEKAIVAVIKEKKIMRISHVFAFYPNLSRPHFYNLDLDKSDKIKRQLEQNRTTAVDYLLKKWIESDNATLQIAAMRLICEKEEHQLLNQQYIDHTTGGEAIKPVIKFTDD